jgi:hypothetical protein
MFIEFSGEYVQHNIDLFTVHIQCRHYIHFTLIILKSVGRTVPDDIGFLQSN